MSFQNYLDMEHLQGLSKSRKTSLDVHLRPCSTKVTSPHQLLLLKLYSNSQLHHDICQNPAATTVCASCRQCSKTTRICSNCCIERESETGICDPEYPKKVQDVGSGLEKTSIGVNESKNSLLKGSRNKENLKIRFEAPDFKDKSATFGSATQAKANSLRNLSIKLKREEVPSNVVSLKHYPSSLSNSCNRNFLKREIDQKFASEINPQQYAQNIDANDKVRKRNGLRKLLTKSKSFVFGKSNGNSTSAFNTQTLSRKDLIEKYKKKNDFDTNSKSSLQQHKKSNIIQTPFQCGGSVLQLCKSCGNIPSINVDLVDFCPIPRKYATLQAQAVLNTRDGYEHQSWMDMKPEDIYSYGKYSQLTSDKYFTTSEKNNKPDSLSLSFQHCHKSKIPSSFPPKNTTDNHKNKNDKNKEQGRLGGGQSKLFYNHSKYKKVYRVQQAKIDSIDATTMYNYYHKYNADGKHGFDLLDQHQDFFNQSRQPLYDCRIPRPKLKYVIPTHSYASSCLAEHAKKTEKPDSSGFTEVSLSNDEDEDAAYGSGSGSHSSTKSSNFRSEHSSFLEFEKEQEQSIFNETSRLLSLKRSNFTPLLAPKHSFSNTNKGKADQQHIIKLLKSHPLFKKLGNGFLTILSMEQIIEVNFDCGGEYIIRQGTRGEGLFILISGTAKVTFTNVNGEEIYLKTLHPDDIFGEKSLQGDQINRMNVLTTDETVSCLLISEEGFQQIISKSTEMKARFCDNKTYKTSLDSYFDRVELDDLRFISTLGIGGFGRVELVQTNQNQSYALKKMKKFQIVNTRQIDHIMSEKSILMEVNCDFITKLYKTFKDEKYLYMLMECCLGGELWTILRDRGHFNDATTRFYIACVIEALKYLHSRNIIYRDLKPENLLLDETGYLKLADFGFAKQMTGNKTWTFCGTPEYVSPEVILNKGHGLAADFWGLGVLTFELLTGTPPFVGGDPMRTYKLILKGIEYIEYPETISKHANSFIRKLCRENPEDRLGFGSQRGISEIKRHKWLDGRMDWSALRARRLTPPICPIVENAFDRRNFDDYPPETGIPPDDNSGWDWDF